MHRGGSKGERRKAADQLAGFADPAGTALPGDLDVSDAQGREAVVRNAPVGLGMPVFDKLEADLAKALMSLPATKGFEIGSGFEGTRLLGSQHNDAFLPSEAGRLRTATTNSGGIQGGISNGEPILIRVAFKPTATIRKAQQTINDRGEATTLAAKGRHDPCVLLRADGGGDGGVGAGGSPAAPAGAVQLVVREAAAGGFLLRA